MRYQARHSPRTVKVGSSYARTIIRRQYILTASPQCTCRSSALERAQHAFIVDPELHEDLEVAVNVLDRDGAVQVQVSIELNLVSILELNQFEHKPTNLRVQ